MKTLIIKIMGLYLNLMAYVTPRAAGQKGFLLFCRPFRIPFNQKQKEFFNTADRQTIRHDETQIQVYRWGKGPKKVVFLHGWQSHSYRWKAYIESLSKEDYTLYALDAPGHGASSGNFLSVPIYSDLIQQFLIELGDVDTVIGHSLGGFSLVYTLHQYPLLPVRKVILMAPPGEATDFVDVFTTTLGLSAYALKQVRNHFVNQYGVGPEYFSTAKFAATLKLNGLIIHDEKDLEAPLHHAVKIHEAWQRSQLMITKGFGHNLRSASVVTAVVDFIDGGTMKDKNMVSLIATDTTA
jgi:pimeloyl-ACP methyl ester carboxylesterase